MKIIVTLLLMSFFITNSFAMTQDELPRTTENTKEQMRSSLSATCPKSFHPIIEKYQSSMTFIDENKLTNDMCACTINRFFSDRLMNSFFELPENELKERINSPEFKAYFFGLFSASGLSCLGDSMNEQLKNANLEF